MVAAVAQCSLQPDPRKLTYHNGLTSAAAYKDLHAYGAAKRQLMPDFQHHAHKGLDNVI